MRRWFRDTLFLRLFVLMWVALVVSHIAAFGVVTSGWLPFARGDEPVEGGIDERGRRSRVPVFPSLPPTPGLHLGPPPWAGDVDRPPPPGGDPDRPRSRRAGRGLPTPLLVVDYLIRLVVIAAAAWLGARWLALPVRRLVDASATLGVSLGADAPLPLLDERVGTFEVREAARVFNRMARELDATFRARGLLMAALSHDLRTPLTRMRVRLETDSQSPVAARCIVDIREMNELIETALDVFRNASDDEPLRPVDVTALARSMADDMAEAGQVVTLHGEPAIVLARPVALRRVLANLFDNAIRYGASADVGVDSDGERVRVRIDDRGPGIASDLLEQVFQPFFRVEASRNRASGGSGLGLYIARDLLRRQGGDVTLANRPGGGLRAEMVLPRAPATKPAALAT
jgi:signal transduction histidine kinase